MPRRLLLTTIVMADLAGSATVAPLRRPKPALQQLPMASRDAILTATVEPCRFCDDGPCRYCNNQRIVPTAQGERTFAAAVPHRPPPADAIGWYLQAAGQQRLLEPHEEVELSRHVQSLLTWEREAAALSERFGHAPSDAEMAVALRLSGGASEYSRERRRLQGSRQLLISSNLRLVVSIATKHLHQGLGLQDLIQEGSIGLIKAAERFDPSRGLRFSTYATWWIRGEVKRGISQHSRTIRVPDKIHQALNKLRKARAELALCLERPPTDAEMAEHMRVTQEELRSIDTSSLIVSTVSMHAPLFSKRGSEAKNLEHVLCDPRAKPEEACMVAMSRESLQREVVTLIDDTLTEEESIVLKMRYGLGHQQARTPGEAEGERVGRGYGATLVQIARDLSISHSLVRSILNRAMKKLRKHSSLQGLHDNHLVSS